MYKKSIIIFLSFFLCLPSYAEEIQNADNSVLHQKNCDEEKLLRNARLFFNIIEQLASGNESPNSDNLYNLAPDIINPNFVVEVRPRTLNVPTINWQQYKEYLSGLSEMFDTFEVTIERSTVAKYRVFLESRDDAKIKESAGGGRYGQEFLHILEFDRKYRVKKFIEYADSLYSTCFFNPADCPASSTGNY